MYLSPIEAIKKGWISFPETIDIEKHIQQIGIDIDVNTLFSLPDENIILGGPYEKKITPQVIPQDVLYSPIKPEIGEYFLLEQNKVYLFDSSFSSKVPSDVVVYIKNRSTLSRNGLYVNSGFYDPGYEGIVGGAIHTKANKLYLYPNTRVAQIVFVKAKSASLYKGQYQNKKSSQ